MTDQRLDDPRLGGAPATLNNVAFAALHVTVLLSGARTAFGFGSRVEVPEGGEVALAGTAGRLTP